MKYIASSLILVFAILFLGYGFRLTHPHSKDFNSYEASFQSIGHLKPGAAVDIAGVKVGYVKSVKLDLDSFSGKVKFAVDKAWLLPDDSKLGIGSPTLNSAEAIEITPGVSQVYLVPGNSFSKVVNPLGIEERISNYIFGVNLGD